MKSSRPGSAQCRSSNTSDDVPGGDPLEEGPPGGEQLRRDRRRRRSTPSSASRAGSIQRALVLVGDVLARPSRRRGAGRRLVVGLEQAGPRADHLAEGPEADALAVGGRAAAVPEDVVDEAVDVLQELPGEPALADAGRADDRHEPGAAVAAGGVEQVLEQPQLVVAADERRLERVARGRGRRARRRPAALATPAPGLALPLSTCSSTGSKAIATLAARCVASPTSTVPGAATDCSRTRC